MYIFFSTTEALAESDSDSDGEVGASAPPLTKQISNILNRYPEGGQILKVCKNYSEHAVITLPGVM